MKTPEGFSTVFIVNFGCIPHHVLVFVLMTLNKSLFAASHPINL